MTEGLSLNHPCDFFRHQQLAVIPGSCFVIMPFDPRFNIVYETIEGALKGRMVCKRADDLALGHSVLHRILEGISTAELVIAVLTGKNPNVFYELGLAHSCTKDVLLLAQRDADVPFDLKGLFYKKYDPNSPEGRERLAEAVLAAAEHVRERRLPTMLEGATSRTRQIIGRMQAMLATPEKLPGLLIRHQAGYSSLTNLGYPDSGDVAKREYGELLEQERLTLIELIERGASLRAILCPPGPAWTKHHRAQQRLELLLDFLKQEDAAASRCEFAIASEEGLNCLFFGEDILFEGHKTGVEGGFGWTAVYTNRPWLQIRIKIFDLYFTSARQYTLRTYGDESDGEPQDDSRALRRAFTRAIEAIRRSGE